MVSLYTQALPNRKALFKCKWKFIFNLITKLVQMLKNKKSFQITKKRKSKRVDNKSLSKLNLETNQIILDMLVETVNSEGGTASKARIKNMIVAGKTGTAKETLAEETTYTGTFAGFVPSKDPEFLAVVVLHGLSGEDYSGGKVSAPVFSNIMQQIFLSKDLKI